MFKELIQRFTGKKRDGRLHPESDYILSFSENTVCCLRPDGIREEVNLSEIQRVEIHTNSLGPSVPDVFYVLHGEKRGCVVPMGATNEQILLDRLFALPGFDSDIFIEGMSSTDDREFLVWQRK